MLCNGHDCVAGTMTVWDDNINETSVIITLHNDKKSTIASFVVYLLIVIITLPILYKIK